MAGLDTENLFCRIQINGCIVSCHFFLAFTSKYLQLLFDGEMTAASRVHQHTLPENVRGVSPRQGIALWNCIIIHWFFGQSSWYQQDHEPASKYT
jgi:hypothetical protein